MSTYDDKKDAKGRSWDQITKNGTSSAGSMGVGGTGDSGKLQREAGNEQSGSRTDDLLDDGSSQEQDTGYSRGGQVETGLEGIGNLSGGAQGNRQSGVQDRQTVRRAEDRGDDDKGNKGQQNR
ncbi:hypothetical protein [Massilia sp. Leaf139]|uniref:hypothetical protein n=1 Tax=Massilia sp. Leaf139 TaxID=1736272 RepID=UPI0006FC915F|nr:hypothetical protein [Massilia sp. Leaf139]KQQ97309.1 hypothetical protein ASF77_04985 [Massilia sp. Leaf139]